MVNKQLLFRIYEAASMQRWNDQIRTVDLTELDKQAHKMVIAYCLAKCEEDSGNKNLDWIQIIEAGIFEFLQRIILTDLKPPLFHRIKENREKYKQVNEWVYKRIEPAILGLGQNFCTRFKGYLTDTERNLNRRIISAAHFYATKWEFDIIERASPKGYLIDEIKRDLQSKQNRYSDLKSMQRILQEESLQDFINIAGQLRFQIRWSHLHRVPKTSVLGHMLIVAIFSYLFSLQIKASKQRCIFNYFTGLFHDLPEVLTRDIINPVKRSVEGLSEIIKEYEKEEMERRIYKLIPKQWHKEMASYTENEFTDLITDKGVIKRDGQLIKAVDNLAAFIEAYLSLKNGIQSRDLKLAESSLKKEYKSQIIAGIDFGDIYNSFD